MAIIAEQKQEMQQGYNKTIDESGIMLMFDVLQKYQYAYPVRSTVRELLSNGIDSITEKNMAREILTGRKQVSDFFVDIDGTLYQDSRFDKNYYSLNWLDKKDTVSLTYYEGPQMQKDKVVIADSGVGLGGSRLEKYFRLGYSTKRLSKLPLGKFGVGAKSPLSIGIDFYTVESRYNGALYRFNVYSHKIDSIIPQYDLNSMTENEFVWFGEDKFEDGGTGTKIQVQWRYKVYYEKTTLKNGFSITVEAKKHHKAQYIDAVKSQMLYFDGIECKIVSENGTEEKIDYKAGILYEDEFIIMSDNKYYTQPHLLLNKVNYGYIDWTELELETKMGNIGIKVAPEEVDVNPSRESVLWSEKTKAMVAERFDNVVSIASRMIQEELQEPDFVKWLKICYEISGSWSRSTGIVGRLANIVDLSKVRPKFNPNPKIQFSASKPMPGIYKRYVEFGERKNRETGETKKIIKRTERDSLGEARHKPLILMPADTRVSNRKDKYLLSLYEGFTLIDEPHGTEEEMSLANVPEEMLTFYMKSDTTGIFRKEIWNLLVASTEVMFYDKIEVPESFTGTDEEEAIEEEDTKEEKQEKEVSTTTAAERRKLEGKTIVHGLHSCHIPGGNATISSAYVFTKMEIPIKSINDWQGEEVYVANDADADTLQLIGLLTRDPVWQDLTQKPVRGYAKDYKEWAQSKWYRLNKGRMNGLQDWEAYNMQHYFDPAVRLIKVSQANNRYYRDFKKVQEFFITIKGKTITMSNLLIQWNTARIIKTKLASAAFLWNFEQFNSHYANLYRTLCAYVDKHYREVEQYTKGALANLNQVTYEDLVNHLDDVQRFQEFVTNPQATPEGISQLAKKLFSNPDLKDGMAVDPEIMRMMQDVQEYSVACGEMLNWVPVLTGYDYAQKPDTYSHNRKSFNIPTELGFEIHRYLDERGVGKWESATTHSLLEQPEEEPELLTQQ